MKSNEIRLLQQPEVALMVNDPNWHVEWALLPPWVNAPEWAPLPENHDPNEYTNILQYRAVPLNPGPGWVELEEGATLLPGDVYWSSAADQWAPTTRGDFTVAQYVEPGEGYWRHVGAEPAPEPEPGLYLYLFHGRPDPEADMGDWGQEGPIFGPLRFVHTTYGTNLKIQTEDGKEGIWFLHDDMLHYGGLFYGDWSVAGAPTPEQQHRLQPWDPALLVPAPKPVPAPTPGPDPGEGYRTLAAGETLQPGDQYWSAAYREWAPTSLVGCQVEADEYHYRRPIRPRWRILIPGEVIQDGDTQYTPGGWTWENVPDNRIGTPHRDGDLPMVREVAQLGRDEMPQYRRKIEAGAGWRLVPDWEQRDIGDQYHDGVDWRPLPKGYSHTPGTLYRRLLNPHWRLLNPDEEIQMGDHQYCIKTAEWIHVDESRIGEPFRGYHQFPIRRLMNPEP